MENSLSRLTLSARWVVPVDGPPISGGQLVVAEGKIVEVAPAGTYSVDRDFGDAVLLPGLVNAHTHLDLTGMRGLSPPTPDFPAWLMSVIRHRRETSGRDSGADVRSGWRECLRGGATLIGDISGDGTSWAELVDAPIRTVVYREMLGLPKDRAERAWQSALEWLGMVESTPNCRPGLSPHAPYSARVSLIKAAAGSERPVAIHLAESTAERELLESHSGPFVSFLQELGVWDPVGLANSPEHVLRLIGDAPTLLIHCNDLAPSATIPETASVVYCPRTHAAFGHAPHPVAAFRSRGIRVALGTDSLASNPDLSMLSEMRFLHAERPDLGAAAIIQMATLAGAEALSFGEECGSLSVGKSADFIVVPLPSETTDDPCIALLESHHEASEVWIRGRRVDAADGAEFGE